MSKKGPYLEVLNWDKECKKDFLTDKGISITESPFTKGVKNLHGIYSPKFATSYDDENSFEEKYSCTCRELQGKIYENEICPICGSKVEFIDVDLEITGWIMLGRKLGENYIIQPHMYKFLKSIIGARIFNDMILKNKEITRDGQLVKKETKNPFYGIGLIEFRERFDEILEYLYDKRKKKRDSIEFVRKNRDCVFASAIPVFSSVLRPSLIKGENYFLSSINKKYSSIFYLTRLLKNTDKLDKRNKKLNKEKRLGVNDILYRIQMQELELYDLIFDMIDRKEGHIKGELLGGRVNFSARNVIIPDPYLRSDTVLLSYLTFLELYKYEIISLISHMKKINENEAFNIWTMATIDYSQEIFELIKYYINKNKPKVVINRNPTINYGSIMTMQANIKEYQKDDYTMNIPIPILVSLNADFDGDVLNIISLKTKELMEAYDKGFNPRKNMFISRDDGLFNSDFGLFKSQIIGLYEFNNI